MDGEDLKERPGGVGETPTGSASPPPGDPEEERSGGAEADPSEVERLNDRYLRLAAEFDNYRRRMQGELAEAWPRAQADLVRRLLDPVDDLKRVALLEPDCATVESIVEGVDLVERKLMKALLEAGVEVIDPVDGRFDPEIMEAVMRVPAEDPEEDDAVQQVFQLGYRFKGHLIRPARVSVRKYE